MLVCADEDQRSTARGPTAEAAPLDHTSVRAIVAGIMLAMFLSALEQTIVAPALPTIGRSLADVENLSWVVTALSAQRDGGDAAVRQAVGHLRPPTMMLICVGVFISRLGRLRAGADDGGVDRRRASLQGSAAAASCRSAQTVIADLLSPRERPIDAELHIGHVPGRQHSRPRARRRAHRLCALVADLLDQCAAGRWSRC